MAKNNKGGRIVDYPDDYRTPRYLIERKLLASNRGILEHPDFDHCHGEGPNGRNSYETFGLDPANYTVHFGRDIRRRGQPSPEFVAIRRWRLWKVRRRWVLWRKRFPHTLRPGKQIARRTLIRSRWRPKWGGAQWLVKCQDCGAKRWVTVKRLRKRSRCRCAVTRQARLRREAYWRGDDCKTRQAVNRRNRRRTRQVVKTLLDAGLMLTRENVQAVTLSLTGGSR